MPMTNPVRLHSSAEDLTRDYVFYRLSTPISLIGVQEVPYEELDCNILNDLLDKLQNGVIRKLENFNNLHFLLLLAYDSHGSPRDRYPLWRWYHRIKKKYLTVKHITIDSDDSRQCIINAIENLIDTNESISKFITEEIQLNEPYLNSPIHGLFCSYSPLHTYLYCEQIDKPILNDNLKIFSSLKSQIIKLYQGLSSDLIHFSIVHRKTNLLIKIFEENTNWLEETMSLTTDRGWLPLHYACYVGDNETVKKICEILTSGKSSNPFDIISLSIPNFKQELFEKNPHEFILKTSDVEHSSHTTKQRNVRSKLSIDSHQSLVIERHFQKKLQINGDLPDQASLSKENLNQNPNTNIPNDNDIPDADELELSTLPLIQRDEFVDKLLHMCDRKQMLIPSPLTLACLAICGNTADYEEIVKILLDTHLVEYDGLNHEAILNQVLNYMHKNEYARFQCVQVYRDTETEGPSTYVFYQFDGFLVSQDVKPLSHGLSGSVTTLNTSKNDESDDEHQTVTPITVRCLLTVLVLRDIFLQFPRWDFHLLRENIEEHFSDLENALGRRPTTLYPDGEVMSSRKRSDITWEVIMKYRLSLETGESIYMQVDYYFFDVFGDPLADAIINIYQTPFYVSCMTDSAVMMNMIFDSYFKRRHFHRWGTIAQKHLEHCFDGILQIKNNCTTFLSLCTTLNRYYQVDGDPFIEENSATIQRIFVHAFACCVRRNAKIELDYLIKNHALIYYDSCRTKPSDIQHNILTYCVVRNLAVVFDQLMTNMKTSMYKTYQNSTNPDWQPHIAWKEIIHVIIDPVSQQNSLNEQCDFAQLVCYGDANATSIGTNISLLHATGEEYIRCLQSRRTIIFKAKRRLTRASSNVKRNRISKRQMSTYDPHQMKEILNDPIRFSISEKNGVFCLGNKSSGVGENEMKKSRNIFKSVNRLRWGGKQERQSITGLSTQQRRMKKRTSSPVVPPKFDQLSTPADAVSLPDVNDSEPNENGENSDASDATCPTTPILNNQPRLQRRQTIDSVRTRQNPTHRTALEHLQAMLRPIRQKIKTSTDNVHEQLSVTNRKRSIKLRRAESVYDNDLKHGERTNERRTQYHAHQGSGTVDVV